MMDMGRLGENVGECVMPRNDGVATFHVGPTLLLDDYERYVYHYKILLLFHSLLGRVASLVRMFVLQMLSRRRYAGVACIVSYGHTRMVLIAAARRLHSNFIYPFIDEYNATPKDWERRNDGVETRGWHGSRQFLCWIFCRGRISVYWTYSAAPMVYTGTSGTRPYPKAALHRRCSSSLA